VSSMSILFVLLKAPHEYHSLDAMAALGGDDKIGALLLEDATLYAVFKDKKDEIVDAADEIFVMGEDLQARGFRLRPEDGFQEIDYPRAVDLIMEDYDKTITL
jgi:sulfur relay protein TusB/DsrH